MPDFHQHAGITTIHDLGTAQPADLEERLVAATRDYPIGLVLPVTESDMRAEPFGRIIDELARAEFVDTTVVVLNRAESPDAYRQARARIAALGPRANVLWTDGPRGRALHQELNETGFNLSVPGKGRAVWTAFGYLLADPSLKAFVLHDCDIVNFHRDMLVRLCLPMADPSFDFEFCKAFYARCKDRLHGRVVRLLVTPLLQALIALLGNEGFLVFLSSLRYPLAGEFAMTSTLARANRIPSDWGLEVGTLAEVFRNTSMKRCCQVDLGRLYEHKHQPLSLEDPTKGLMRMTGDILTTIYRTLASRGVVLSTGHFVTLRSAYLRAAQDAIRQYHADAIMNSLAFDRHSEEQAIEGFAQQVTLAGEQFHLDPAGAEAMPTWTRVLSALPDFPARLRHAAEQDALEFG